MSEFLDFFTAIRIILVNSGQEYDILISYPKEALLWDTELFSKIAYKANTMFRDFIRKVS